MSAFRRLLCLFGHHWVRSERRRTLFCSRCDTETAWPCPNMSGLYYTYPVHSPPNAMLQSPVTTAQFANAASVLARAGISSAELTAALARVPPPSPGELALFAAYEARRGPWRRFVAWLTA